MGSEGRGKGWEGKGGSAPEVGGQVGNLALEPSASEARISAPSAIGHRHRGHARRTAAAATHPPSAPCSPERASQGALAGHAEEPPA